MNNNFHLTVWNSTCNKVIKARAKQSAVAEEQRGSWVKNYFKVNRIYIPIRGLSNLETSWGLKKIYNLMSSA